MEDIDSELNTLRLTQLSQRVSSEVHKHMDKVETEWDVSNLLVVYSQVLGMIMANDQNAKTEDVHKLLTIINANIVRSFEVNTGRSNDE